MSASACDGIRLGEVMAWRYDAIDFAGCITYRWMGRDVKPAKTNKKPRFRGVLSVFLDCIGQSET